MTALLHAAPHFASRRLYRVAAVCTALLSACHRAPGAVADTSLVAGIERGPCRGRCPVYSVQVFADGRVQYEGHQNVAVLGAATAKISLSAVHDLANAIAATEFASADTNYTMDSRGCGQYATDLPVSVFSARVGSRTKKVQHDPGCRGAPRYLNMLEAKTDSVAGSARWISASRENRQ